MATLTWTDPERVTNDSYENYQSQVAYAPDRSIVVLYNRNTAGSDGLFLKRRTRDKEWLQEFQVDYLPDVDSVLLDADVNAISGFGSEPWLHVDGDGNIHLMYTQTGYAPSTGVSSIVYRKISFAEGEDYGTPSDKIVLVHGADVVDFAACYNPFDGNIYVAFNSASRAWFAYFNEGLAPGTILSTLTSYGWKYAPPIWDTSAGTQLSTANQIKNRPAIWADRSGGVHAAFITTGDDEVNYFYRPPSSTVDYREIFGTPELAQEALGLAADNRDELSIFARGQSDLYIAYRLTVSASGNQAWYIRRKPGVSGFVATAVTGYGGGAGDPEVPWVVGTETKGQAVLTFGLDGSPEEGLHYRYFQDDVIDGGLIQARSNTSKPLTSLRPAIRFYPKSPYELGYVNPRVGEVALVFTQRP